MKQDIKEELALAILLWKDFKSEGKLDISISIQATKLCDMLGIKEEFNKLEPLVPPMIIKPRY